MSEEMNNTVVLTDENGNKHEFEHLDTIEMNDKKYVVLIPADEEEVDEVIILCIDIDENGNEVLVNVEDEDELNSVFEEFKNRNEQDFDFIDEDNEE